MLRVAITFTLLIFGASAQRLLDFDGLQVGEFPQNYYNGGFGSLGSGPGPNFGVVFPPVPFDCTVANTPSTPPPRTPPNFLQWDGGGCVLNVPAGFIGSLSFYYLASGPVSQGVGVYDGLNLTGGVLTKADLPAVADWTRIAVFFTGTAKSVLLQGPFSVDNVLIGSRYRIGYSANQSIASSILNLTNAGVAPQGNICANIYTFSPDEQMLACCSCTLTPSALASASVRSDLISNSISPFEPSSVVVKVIPSAGPVCNAASVGTGSNAISEGLGAWMTTLHALPTTPTKYGVTEFELADVELTGAELARVTGFCGFIQANGSGFGICRICQPGAK